MIDLCPMKMQSLSPASWPYGLEVQTTREGLLLKPRRNPREGWVKAFRSHDIFSAATDALALDAGSRRLR